MFIFCILTQKYYLKLICVLKIKVYGGEKWKFSKRQDGIKKASQNYLRGFLFDYIFSPGN